MQPVASAGKTFTAIWFIGQFHGVIRPQTPIGSLTISVAPRCSSNVKLFSTSIAVVRWPGPRPHLEALGQGGRRAHLLGDRRGQVAGALLGIPRGCAPAPRAAPRGWSATRSGRPSRAAVTARSTSAADPAAILPETSSVAGLMTSKVCVPSGSDPLPVDVELQILAHVDCIPFGVPGPEFGVVRHFLRVGLRVDGHVDDRRLAAGVGTLDGRGRCPRPSRHIRRGSRSPRPSCRSGRSCSSARPVSLVFRVRTCACTRRPPGPTE